MTRPSRTVLAVALGLASASVAHAQDHGSEPPTVALSAMSEAAARTIQTKLRELGFYHGEIDGIVGPATRRALRAFYQAQADLVSEGKLLADSAPFDTNGAGAARPARAEQQPVRGEKQPERVQKHPMEVAPTIEPMRGVSPAQGVSPTEGVKPQEAAPPQPGQQAAPRHAQPRRDSTNVGPQHPPDPGPSATISPTPTTTLPPATKPSPKP